MKTLPLIPMATAVLVACSFWPLAEASENDYELAIGFVAYEAPSIYAGGDDNESFLATVEWEWQNWFYRDYSLGSYLAGNDHWYVSAALSLDAFGDAGRGGSRELEDMKELDDVYTAEISTGWIGSLGDLELSYRQDISGNHEGGSTMVRYGYPIGFQQWSFYPYVQATHSGSQVVRYYVGVNAEEARAGRPEYRPGGAFQYQAGLHLSRHYGESHRVLFGFNHRRLSSEVYNSPIVGRRRLWSVSAGYFYAF